MEFAQGQVSKIGKIAEYIKSERAKKQTCEQERLTKELFVNAKTEIDTLRSSLNNLTDKEAIESGIYRLKAAEIDLIRHIRTTKSAKAE